ncbi:MAG: alpha/beta fold hydrolase [Rhodocyclales bacterium]|nr:alpha/beta fold hydrolase [Rhodocyclales bacterium]
MELKLKPAFFWPFNRTIVRAFKFSIGLTWQRALYRLLWRSAPQQAIEHAARRMLTPPGHHFPDAELRLMEDASLIPVPLVTGRLIGWRWGHRADPIVVLVHGWGGRGTQLKAFIAPLLKRGFSVVAYDAPGHGMTGGPESSLPHFLRALEAMLDHLGPVHALVGHSLGGAAAAMVMARRPQSAGRAVLIAPPASLTESTRRLARALTWPEAMRAAVQRRIEYRFGIAWSEFEVDRNTGPQPLLVIHDRGDREVPYAEGMRYVNAWPAARMLETGGLGHRQVLNDPTAIGASVDFIAGARP